MITLLITTLYLILIALVLAAWYLIRQMFHFDLHKLIRNNSPGADWANGLKCLQLNNTWSSLGCFTGAGVHPALCTSSCFYRAERLSGSRLCCSPLGSAEFSVSVKGTLNSGGWKKADSHIPHPHFPIWSRDSNLCFVFFPDQTSGLGEVSWGCLRQTHCDESSQKEAAGKLPAGSNAATCSEEHYHLYVLFLTLVVPFLLPALMIFNVVRVALYHLWSVFSLSCGEMFSYKSLEVSLSHCTGFLFHPPPVFPSFVQIN